MRIIFPLSALLLSSLIIYRPAAGAATGLPVLDVTSRKVWSRVDYYILPVMHGFGGGLTLAERNLTCPLTVAQERTEKIIGLPLTFLPVNTSDQIVPLSTDVNIMFSAATICVQSTVWRVDRLNDSTGRTYIMTGGVTGNPGIGTVNQWFKIEKYGDNYKLVFCPNVCKFCKVICGDVGIFVEKEKRWLGLADQPFAICSRRPKEKFNSVTIAVVTQKKTAVVK